MTPVVGLFYAKYYQYLVTSCPGHHGFWLHTATRHLLDLGVGCGFCDITLSFLQLKDRLITSL